MSAVRDWGSVQLHQGDCREVMRTLGENSIDAIVTDPPYELGFMGSGSTGKAARLEGLRFIGIEREHQYLAIAERRMFPWAFGVAA